MPYRAPRITRSTMTQNVKPPRVSVLMATYNVEKYVAESIESVLNQTFADFEFIIIDDSTDNTPNIIEKYAKQDPRIKFIHNKEKSGLVASLNYGLGLCRGEYIARMDGDDISLPRRLEKQVEYMASHLDCGVLGTWIEKFGENIKTTIHKYPTRMGIIELIRSCSISNPSVMIRAKTLRDNDICYDNKYEQCEDYALWAQLITCTQIHNLPDVLLRYRWHSTNTCIVKEADVWDYTNKISDSLLTHITYDEECTKYIRQMTHVTIQRFYLFGVLPIIRRKQYGLTKTKYYLFEKIPLLKIQSGKIYLFECIKIGTIK